MTSGDPDIALLPLIPLRDCTLKPGEVLALFVGRPASLSAIRASLAGGTQTFVVSQRNADLHSPRLGDLHAIGTVADVRVLLKLPDGTNKVEFTGRRLARLTEIVQDSGYQSGRVEPVAAADDAKMGVPPPRPLRGERPDDIIETISLPGFDPLGDPELRRERSGNFWLVFNFMPPSWVPRAEYSDFGRCARFDEELQAAIGSPVLWDDREFFLIEQPTADCVDRIRRFLSEFRSRNEPAV